MNKSKLPEKYPELELPATQAEREAAEKIKRYNSLPAGHPDRQGIYEEIMDLKDYIENWD